MQGPGMNILRGSSNARMKGLDFPLKALGEDFLGDLVVKTLPSSAGVAGLIPGQGAKISPAFWPKKKTQNTQKQCCNKFNKDCKNGPLPKKIFKNESKNKGHGSH